MCCVGWNANYLRVDSRYAIGVHSIDCMVCTFAINNSNRIAANLVCFKCAWLQEQQKMYSIA